MMDPLSLDPTNPFSPLSPVHPLNTETRETLAPLPRRPGITIDWTVNSTTWLLFGVAALLLAGWLWGRKRQLHKDWAQFKAKKVAEKKPECQSCRRFISCAMAGVQTCPLLEESDG